MRIIEESLSTVKPNKNVIPESCLTYSEQALYTSDAITENYAQFMENVGIKELMSFEESGSLVVYENATLDSLKNDVTRLMENNWSVLKGFWQEAYTSFKEQAESVKAIKVTLELVQDKNFGKVHTFYESSVEDVFASNMVEFNNTVKKAYEDFLDGVEPTLEQVKDLTESLESQMIPSICGLAEGTMMNEMKKMIKTKLLGSVVEVNTDFINENAEKMDYMLEDGILLRINEMYDNEKQAIGSIIETFQDTLDESNSAVVSDWLKLCTEMVSTLHNCYASELDVLKREFVEYKSIAAKAAKYSD